jgi:hypothetical protein
MEKLATQILDIQDDKEGTILREYFDSLDEVPEIIKQASAPDISDDSNYALVMMNDGFKYQKYPINDVGNTVLSAMYFVKQAHLLPDELVKIAAESITEACSKHKIDVPIDIKEMVDELRANGKNVQIRERWWITPHVLDVSKMEVKGHTEKRAAEYTLLDNQYPVDTYEQAKLATDYFDEHWREFEPQDRREYCVKLAARLQDLALKVPANVERYSSPTYAHDLDMHIDYRKSQADEVYHSAYDTLLEKKAAVSPEYFAEVLSDLDELSGLNYRWDSKVSDPYYATFGPSLEKVANIGWCYNANGLFINEDKLYNAANNKQDIIRRQFGNEFADKFLKNPLETFKELPERLLLTITRS